MALAELPVAYVADRFVLVLPENYPQGPAWIDGTRLQTGDLMTVVVEKW